MLLLLILISALLLAGTTVYPRVYLAIALLAWIIGIATSVLALDVLGLLSSGALYTVQVLTLAVLIAALWKRRSSFPVLRTVWLPIATMVLVLGIVSAQFLSVHYGYTGPATTTFSMSYVTDDTYLYPLFSDEWVTLAIATHVLRDNMPFSENPFTGASYVNLLTVFQAFVTGVIGSSGMSAATAYVLLAVGVGSITAAMVGVLLAALRVPFGFVVLGMLTVPFVVNGSNLPMLWYLLPWNVSFLFLLGTCILLLEARLRWALLTAALAVVVYPPMVVFVLPMLLVYASVNQIRLMQRHVLQYVAGVLSLLALFFGVLLLVTDMPFTRALEHVVRLIVRPRGESAYMAPPFYLWQVVPLFLVPCIVYSFFVQRTPIRYLRAPVLVGLVGWAVFSVSPYFIIIDYYRVVAITALLLVPIGIFAVATLWPLVVARWAPTRVYQFSVVGVGVLLVGGLLLTPGYAGQERWRAFRVELPAAVASEQFVVEPAAPVNRYLHPDDLELFASLSGERFLAPAWKGLVLGALTDNDPLFTKPSTITVRTVSYQDFMAADCAAKAEMVKRSKMTYVYGEKINCPGYISERVSAEGLHLSRIVLQ